MKTARNSFGLNWWRAVAAVAALLVAPMAAAQSAEGDNRNLDTLARPYQVTGWEGVGRLDMGRGGFCTGTLIASDLVLTAAHCLFNSDTGERVDPRDVKFRAGLSDGSSVAERHGRRAVVHPDYAYSSGDKEIRVSHDVALVELDAPVIFSQADPFRASRMQGEGIVSVVSVGRGRSQTLSREGQCKLVAQTREIMAFDCNTTFGSSGAPVFQKQGNVFRIVSVVSAGGELRQEPVTFGMDLSAVLGDVQSALRSGRGVWPAATAGQVRRLTVGEGSRTTQSDSGARFLKP